MIVAGLALGPEVVIAGALVKLLGPSTTHGYEEAYKLLRTSMVRASRAGTKPESFPHVEC